MKNRVNYSIGATILLVLATASHTFMQGKAEPRLTLRLSSEKATYKLGEPINFHFELKNESGGQVELLEAFEIAIGSIRLEVSSDGKVYSPCADSGWGFLDLMITSPLQLPAGQSVETSGNILWLLSAQNEPEFRFREAGSLSFRAKYEAQLVERDGKRTEIPLVSEPIQITLEAPEGEDLEVWNRIKDDGNFALLIQKDQVRIPDQKPEERAKFLAEVGDIIAKHPNSFYAENLRKSLARFNTAEAKRKAMLEKLKPLPPQ